MTTKSKNSVADSRTFQLLRHPVFRAEVNRVAIAKCREAVKAGVFQYIPKRQNTAPSFYIPRMDLVDDPSSSNLFAVFELPGVPLSGLSMHIREGNLVLRGQRRPPYSFTPIPGGSSHTTIDACASENISDIAHTEDQPPTLPVKELYFGDFQRAIPLPAGIKQEDISANLLNGMLTVTWPRSPGSAETSVPSRTPGNITPPLPMAAAGAAMQ